MQSTRLQLSPDRLVTIESGSNTAQLAQFIAKNYLGTPGQPGPLANAQPIGTPQILQSSEQAALPLPTLNFGEEPALAEHYRKQHQSARDEYIAELARGAMAMNNGWPQDPPMFSTDEAPLPVPEMKFDAPEPQPRTAADLAASLEKRPAQSAFVGNDQEPLALPAMTF